MKNLFLLLGMIGLMYTNSDAQQGPNQIINGGFEQWDSVPGFPVCAHWHSLNALSLIPGAGILPNTTPDTDSHSGNFAIRLETTPNGFQDIPGMLASGRILNDQFQPIEDSVKFGYNLRPQALTFYFKASPASGDSCFLMMQLTRKDTLTGTIEVVGTAYFSTGTLTSTYTRAEVPFIYNSQQIPDSAFVIAASSYDRNNPKAGSVFQIDDLETGNFNAISNLEPSLSIGVYPNPATDGFTIERASATSESMILTDLSGKVLRQFTLREKAQYCPLDELGAGVYFLFVQNHSGSRKLVITK